MARVETHLARLERAVNILKVLVRFDHGSTCGLDDLARMFLYFGSEEQAGNGQFLGARMSGAQGRSSAGWREPGIHSPDVHVS